MKTLMEADIRMSAINYLAFNTPTSSTMLYLVKHTLYADDPALLAVELDELLFAKFGTDASFQEMIDEVETWAFAKLADNHDEVTVH